MIGFPSSNKSTNSKKGLTSKSNNFSLLKTSKPDKPDKRLRNRQCWKIFRNRSNRRSTLTAISASTINLRSSRICRGARLVFWRLANWVKTNGVLEARFSATSFWSKCFSCCLMIWSCWAHWKIGKRSWMRPKAHCSARVSVTLRALFFWRKVFFTASCCRTRNASRLFRGPRTSVTQSD